MVKEKAQSVEAGGVEGASLPEGMSFKEVSGKLGEVGFKAEVLQAGKLDAVYSAYEAEGKDGEYVESVLLACWNRSQVSLAKRVTGGMKSALETGDEGKISAKIAERIADIAKFLQPVPTGRKGRKSRRTTSQPSATGSNHLGWRMTRSARTFWLMTVTSCND